MSKNYRVKRYYGKNATSYRAKPRPLTIVFLILLFSGFVYLGTVIYEPAYDFVMNIGKTPPLEDIVLEPPPESVSDPVIDDTVEPAPPKKAEYQKLRAVYVSDTSDPSTGIDAVIDQIAGTDINAIMIDIKAPTGDILFKTRNEQANKWNLVTQNAVDLKALSAKLEAKNLTLVAKMSVFRDAKAASAGRLAYAINYQNSEFLWLDNSAENGGKPWLNPYSLLTQDYISSLAKEAFDSGVKLLVLENLQFPDNSGVFATFGKDAVVAMSRSEILQTTLSNLEKAAEERDARVALSFSVVTATQTNGEENRYGGSILKVPDSYLLLNVEPSQFGDSFNSNGLAIQNAKQNPAETAKAAINYIKQGISSETEIIPMLGGDETQLQAQINAVKELGYDEYFVIK